MSTKNNNNNNNSNNSNNNSNNNNNNNRNNNSIVEGLFGNKTNNKSGSASGNNSSYKSVKNNKSNNSNKSAKSNPNNNNSGNLNSGTKNTPNNNNNNNSNRNTNSGNANSNRGNVNANRGNANANRGNVNTKTNNVNTKTNNINKNRNRNNNNTKKNNNNNNSVTTVVENKVNNYANAVANTFNNVAESVGDTIDAVTGVNNKPAQSIGDDSNFMFVLNIILVIILCIIVFYIIRYFMTSYQNYYINSPYLLDGTKNAKHTNVVSQDPNSVNYIPMKRSEDKDGIEFSYDFWILIESYEYKKGEWKHVFHKGNSTSMPNRAPGVYLHPDKNSMRIYMNTLDDPFEFVDIDNLPLRKWIHMSITLRNKELNVYVNNQLKKSMKLSSLPRQNNGNFWININGGFEGYLSNIRYYSYAINFNEIDNNTRKGPSSDACVGTSELPPYFDNDWWSS
jgi:hypothetical protein